MNYGEIERQTFRAFLAFSGLLISALFVFFNITSNFYRISNILYNNESGLNISSIEKLYGTSIWLIDDNYFEIFYTDNPSVENITIKKELPSTLVVDVVISEQIAYILDNRQSPPRTSILHKNMFITETIDNNELVSIKITNGPVRDGFYEEVITFVMTLKKYSVNLSNVDLEFDGVKILVYHFNSKFDLGDATDLGRKASIIGYYLTESPCDGEVRIVYNEEGNEIRAVANCK